MPKNALTNLSFSLIESTANIEYEACSFVKKGTVPSDRGFVFVATPQHPVLGEVLKRIKELNTVTGTERENPSVLFFKLVASSFLTDTSVCEQTDKAFLSETSILLLPDGVSNPLW